MPRRESAFLGPLLIVVGLLLLLAQAGFPAFRILWPLFPFAVGVVFLLRYWRNRDDSSQVFVGVLLILIAGLFLLVLSTRLHLGDHWPFFILAPGLAFLARYVVDQEDRDSLLFGGLMVAVGIIFYFFSSDIFSWMLRTFLKLLSVLLKVGIPLGLIAWGSWLLLRRNVQPAEPRSDVPEKIEPPIQDGFGPGDVEPGPPEDRTP